MNDTDLQILGRDHTTKESIQCIKEAKILFPGRVSVDLIFGRPGQTASSWLQELQDVLKICDNHLSLYQLTLERGTALFKMNDKGLLSIPDADLIADMYEGAVDMLHEAGFTRYEVSNFARSCAESEHNKSYWNGGQYIGVGPGAHGRFVPQIQCDSPGGEPLPNCSQPQREARIQTLEPEPWMWEVEHRGHGTRNQTRQSEEDILEELLMLGLRTRQGISDNRWKEFSSGSSLQEVFKENDIVETLTKENLLELDEFGMRVTNRGMSILDSILPDLLNVLNSHNHNKGAW